jgi:hypothetical protein
MSEIFFSATSNGFYIFSIHGSSMPQDAVEITIEQHGNLLSGQSEGKIISSDKNGYPVLIDKTFENQTES